MDWWPRARVAKLAQVSGLGPGESGLPAFGWRIRGQLILGGQGGTLALEEGAAFGHRNLHLRSHLSSLGLGCWCREGLRALLWRGRRMGGGGARPASLTQFVHLYRLPNPGPQIS